MKERRQMTCSLEEAREIVKNNPDLRPLFPWTDEELKEDYSWDYYSRNIEIEGKYVLNLSNIIKAHHPGKIKDLCLGQTLALSDSEKELQGKIAFNKLILLRNKVWNDTNFKSESNNTQNIFTIYRQYDGWRIECHNFVKDYFSFPTREIAAKFLKDNQDLFNELDKLL